MGKYKNPFVVAFITTTIIIFLALTRVCGEGRLSGHVSRTSNALTMRLVAVLIFHLHPLQYSAIFFWKKIKGGKGVLECAHTHTPTGFRVDNSVTLSKENANWDNVPTSLRGWVAKTRFQCFSAGKWTHSRHAIWSPARTPDAQKERKYVSFSH
ncbi:hypothetical protein TRVL_09556 [Trypanosoma vivax]|nr:hypothetical protein TRVL_09556 [Trypanosoma vivax]